MNALERRAEEWRDDAERLRRYGCDRLAETCERHADELEDAFEAYRHEELTVSEAAEETGYSEDWLRQMVREGKIPDTRPPGSQGTIHIKRRDLPRKPAGTESVDLDVVDAMAEELA